MDDEKKTTRKGSPPPIKVYCLPDERALIEENAKRAGMSVGGYLREVGQGYQITDIVDYEHVRELARINGNLGRLSGPDGAVAPEGGQESAPLSGRSTEVGLPRQRDGEPRRDTIILVSPTVEYLPRSRQPFFERPRRG